MRFVRNAVYTRGKCTARLWWCCCCCSHVHHDESGWRLGAAPPTWGTALVSKPYNKPVEYFLSVLPPVHNKDELVAGGRVLVSSAGRGLW